MRLTKCLVITLSLVILAGSALAVSPAARVKDIAYVLGARENQVMGFGLVVGLNNTGDKTQTGFTQQALTNLLSRMGVVPQTVDFKSRNAAAVMITATLPPFVKVGQKLDVTVSSVGDATSLQGGTLLMTPLQGADDQVYAVAQGSLIVGADPSSPSIPYSRQRQVTVGRVPGGGLVEKEVPVTLLGKSGITIVLNEPDFTTANRLVASVRRAGFSATAKDAATVNVPIEGEDVIETIARLENLTVTPDTIAKIVINERTGTVVIGENVVIAPVAVSYGGIDVFISNLDLYSEGRESESAQEETRYTAQGRARMKKKEGKMTLVPGSPTLATLVRGLNTIGASHKDMIAILQAMKRAGAIKAELEVI
ncbi:MAG: flagellar basal body P-ring protein FlgI [Candidatus Margulisiibacteriota bacterium]